MIPWSPCDLTPDDAGAPVDDQEHRDVIRLLASSLPGTFGFPPASVARLRARYAELLRQRYGHLERLRQQARKPPEAS